MASPFFFFLLMGQYLIERSEVSWLWISKKEGITELGFLCPIEVGEGHIEHWP